MKIRNLNSILLFLFFAPSVALSSVKMAVTVDDLPTHGKLPPGVSRIEITKSMLATFKANNVPEVYGFINAGHVGQDKGLIEVLSLWIKAGYPLGNHTWSHKRLNKISAEDFNKDIAANEPTLREVGGQFDWRYFRYPFLDEGESLKKRNSVRIYLRANKYKMAFVTDDFEDWAWNDPYARCKRKNDQKSIQSLKESYVNAAAERFILDGKILNAIYQRPVARILLLHIGAFGTEMLPAILNFYKGKGVEFIPLSEAVKDPIYDEDLGTARGGGGGFQYNALKAKGLTIEGLGIGPAWRFPEKELSRICTD